jgi:hypothetical protein
MPPVPPEQSAEHSTPPSRGPHDHDTRPHGRTKYRPAEHDNQSSDASPHRRQGDRGSGDDDVPPLQRWIRYADLKRARIVGNWTQLLRLIELQNFPPGTMLSPKVRAWTVSEIEGWLASRPPAGKRHEQDADAAGRARKAAATR